MNHVRLFTTTWVRFKPKVSDIDFNRLPSRNSNNLSSGVVGLANVGKSTFFQAITKTKLGNPANYPFATIEPEESKILVQSTRLDKLSKLYGSKKKIPTSLKIFDIAGLTRNASNGEGLGNKFLEDIRQVDGIFQIVRGFRDDSIIHIENNVDPVRDLVIVMDELILKDLEFVESGIDKLEKTIKKPNQPIDKMKKELKLLEEFQEMLYEGKKIGTFKFKDIESVEMTRKYNFLTIKPTVYLLNVNKEDYLRNDTEFKKDIEVWLQENCPNDKLMLICAQYENDKLDNPQEEDTESNRLNGVVEEMRDSLSLISYFTCGPQEAREWTIKRGTGAADAAAVIHNDLKDSFIAAQVYKYSDVIKLAEKNEKVNESELKAKGLQYRYGKDHVVEDGDIILFKSAKGKH